MNQLLSPNVAPPAARAITRARPTGGVFSLLAVATLAATAAGAAEVFTETNSAAGNEILRFRSGDDGSGLTLATRTSTGGLGTDGGLGNQGAIALSGDGHRLFAVNAGSNDVSVFALGEHSLELVDRVPSGGTEPVSLALDGDLLYVLNAGGAGNISGFRVSAAGHLDAIPGSTRPLSAPAAGAAQVGFDREGEELVVTEKATNRIDLYIVADGLAQGPYVQASHGLTPFGFAFDRRDHLLVSEAHSNALSSYDLVEAAPGLALISGSVATQQIAACWVAIAGGGRFAYTTNTASGSVTGFRIERTGTLSSLTPGGQTAVTGGAPTDMAVSRDGRLLFVLTTGLGGVAALQVHADGSLTAAGSATGVPSSASGLAAR